MSDTVTFTSAVLESFSRTNTGGKAKFSAALTDKVRDALGWKAEVPDYFTGGTPEADLHAKEAQLVPSEKELHKHRIGLSIQQVHRFELVRLELVGKKKKGHRLELRFDVKFSDTRGCEKLERYMQTIGEGKGSLTVTYTPQQELQLDEPKATAQQRLATSPEND